MMDNSRDRVAAFFEDQKTSYLSHSGILGQRWGHRRFQNLDGSLTEEGKARYAYKKEKMRYKEREANAKRQYKLEMYKEKNRMKEQQNRTSDQESKNGGGGKEGPKLFKDTKNFRNFLANLTGIAASLAVITKGTKKFLSNHPDLLAKPVALVTKSDSSTIASILKQKFSSSSK